jgi:hypothetical protein
LEDHSLDAIFEMEDVKVDQEAKPHSAQAQISKQLRCVDGMQCFDRLQFHDDALPD